MQAEIARPKILLGAWIVIVKTERSNPSLMLHYVRVRPREAYVGKKLPISVNRSNERPSCIITTTLYDERIEGVRRTQK
jgi:hypothetical protein